VWIAGCFNDVVATADVIERQLKWKDNYGTERRKKKTKMALVTPLYQTP
jgi:hypothetical protein